MSSKNVVANRRGMIEVLEQTVVPALERNGFTGQFPHFRRITPDRIDIVSVFFNPYGNGFVFKLGRCGPDGLVRRSGKRVPPESVTASDLVDGQLSWISPNAASKGGDFWFQYEPADPESLRKAALGAMPFLFLRCSLEH